LSVMATATPTQKYRRSIHFGNTAVHFGKRPDRFGKGTDSGPKLTHRRTAPQPGSPHSKKLRPPSALLSVISSAAPAQKYPLSTQFGRSLPAMQNRTGVLSSPPIPSIAPPRNNTRFPRSQ
jgi:hypothetical protein